jgi:taurine dioxygenase
MAEIEVQPLTSVIGALISGVDVRQILEPNVVLVIRQAILDHGVVFFRNQDTTIKEFETFVRYFGEPVPMDYFADPDDAHVSRNCVTQIGLGPTKRATAVWHSDVTWLAKPPFASVLRAVSVPPFGGDTCWASMEAAYNALSKPFRRMLDGLTAVHSGLPTLEREPVLNRGDAKNRQMDHIHPVVRVHPETGRRSLFVNECATTRIIELNPSESSRVLDVIFNHIRLPDFSVRWHWSDKDLVFWDNRSVQHYAVPDYSGERIMQRAELKGSIPVGPNQAHSSEQ